MAARTLTLEEPACEDVRVAGSKGAFLARARRCGLPVLSGVVLEADASSAAISHGADVLAHRGSGAARLAVMRFPLGSGLGELEREARSLGDHLIVRSSSPIESDGSWAGAFGTLDGVRPGELATAVRGCWASVFNVATLERAEAAGVDPATVRMAVLVQRHIDPVCGGVATVQPDGSVEVVGVRGTPAPLLQGWSPGSGARVGPEGTVVGTSAIEELGEDILRQAAQLATRAQQRTGRGRVEWAYADGRVLLLQAEPVPVRAGAARTGGGQPVGDGLQGPTALRVAGIVHAVCGPLGEALVLPWALGLPSPPSLPAGDPREDAIVALRTATREACHLVSGMWGDDNEARRVLAAVRESDAAALGRIAGTGAPDPAAVRRLLAAFATVADRLVGAGLLGHRDELWRGSVEDIGRALAGGGRPTVESHRQSVLKWQPFLHGAVHANGAPLPGAAVVPGFASGPVVRLVGPDVDRRVVDGSVLVVDRPLPALSALLWNAAGLVVGVANRAAHLLEVARSLGLPTVVGVDLDAAVVDAFPTAGRPPVIASVDGYEGVVVFASPH